MQQMTYAEAPKVWIGPGLDHTEKGEREQVLLLFFVQKLPTPTSDKEAAGAGSLSPSSATAPCPSTSTGTKTQIWSETWSDYNVLS